MFETADSTFCGMQIEASGIKSPLSYFMEYFNHAIFQELAFETNQYIDKDNRTRNQNFFWDVYCYG